MYMRKMIAVIFAFLFLFSGCVGGSGDNFKLKSDLAQDALNKITLYAETEGTSSAPSIKYYTLVGVTSENLTLLNQKVSKSDRGDTDNPRKIEQILKNQNFDGDGVKDRLDNCPFVANTGQADSDNNGIGDACDTTTPVVTKADTSAPVITILGAIPLSLSVGASFSDPGAKVLDGVDGDLINAIKKSSNINAAIAGIYAVN